MAEESEDQRQTTSRVCWLAMRCLPGCMTEAGWSQALEELLERGRTKKKYGLKSSFQQVNFTSSWPLQSLSFIVYLRTESRRVSSAALIYWPGTEFCGSGSSSSLMGKCPKGWWEESKKDELLMPRLMPVTPIPRASGGMNEWMNKLMQKWLIDVSQHPSSDAGCIQYNYRQMKIQGPST